jgi:uncharacterized protein (DUF342 family)
MPEAFSARRILFEDRSERRIVRVWATTDGLVAGLDCQVLAAGWPGASAAELARLLESQKIRQGLDPAALEALVAAVRSGRTEAGCVAARGTPAENGRDGALDFIVPPSSEEARYQHQPGSGRIDFRETNLVQNILAGEPLAIEIPPKPGTDGVNIFGRRLGATQGRPAKFKVGKGVRFDESSRQVLAEFDGRVVWEAGTVSVSDSYHVRGPVDYSIGNIAFVGEVIVDGEVLDGFSVRAGRRLTIGGNLGACRADSEGDLILKGGVFGKGKARLRAKGGLSARFLNDCQAEAVGSVIIEREALNATVLTNRRLLMTAGTFTGGTASALGGADFDTLGSAMGVLTKVSVGTDYNLVRRQTEISGRIAEVDASVAKIEDFLKPLLTDHRRMGRLLGRRREDVEKLVVALRDLRGERVRLAAELEALAESAARGAVSQVNIRRVLHSGVLLEIGSVRHRARQPLPGPVTILEDRAKGALRTVDFRELPTERS